MAKVTKRKLPSGKERWQASYVDGAGNRRFKMFDRKGDGETWLVKVNHDLSQGLHTPASTSPTVAHAGERWLQRGRDKKLEDTTIKYYQEHVLLHINPFIGAKKLSELTAPAVAAFADRLREEGRSAEMIRRVVRSLGGIFKEARRRGLASHYPTDDLDLDLPERDDPRVVCPSKPELQAIIAGAAGRWRPLILVAIFCGLRASELRGLRWDDVSFEDREISVKQRANARNKNGKLKSKAGYRSIPMPPMVLNALREWRLSCPKGELELVFPSGAGNVESHSNVAQRGLEPILRKAGIVVIEDGLDDQGKPAKIEKPKYGLHSLRHACASLWIESGMNAKRIQTLMGHSSITLTYDRYGHLFADGAADQKAAEDIQVRLLGR
jgi:integrase